MHTEVFNKPLGPKGSSSSPLYLRLSHHLQKHISNEHTAFILAGMPEGTHFSAGRALMDRRWVCTLEDLENLALIPPQSFSGIINLSVTIYEKQAAPHTGTLVISDMETQVGARLMFSAANAAGNVAVYVDVPLVPDTHMPRCLPHPSNIAA